MTDAKILYLVKVDPEANNNKFYRMIPNGDDTFTVEYGRIGNSNFQTTTYTMRQWNKKMNEKIKKGYEDYTKLKIKRINQPKQKYTPIQDTHIASIVDRLQSIARQTVEDNYTVSSNEVSQMMIDEAQVVLNDLIELTKSDDIKKFNDVLVNLFKIIPRKMDKVANYLARKKKDFGDILQREQDLLDVMKGQVVTDEVEENIDLDHPTQTILNALKLKFERVLKSEERKIKELLGNISDRYYQAWKVTNFKTQYKFDKFVKENGIEDCRLLWHGSKNANFWSIINTGLLLRPNAPITGKLYGQGCYFAPKAQKSLGYTSLNGSYWAKGNDEFGLMALFNVAYGQPYDVYDFDSQYYDLNYEKLQQFKSGANCLHAHAGAKLGGHSSLKNDEIVVYLESQMTIQYLIELR